MTANYCSNCGEAYKENAIICANCGRPAPQENKAEEKGYEKTEQTENAKTENATAENVETEKVYEEPRRIPIQTKSPFLALILSFFITGLGQVYNGKFWKGIFFVIATFIGACFMIIPGIVVWIWGLYDAYTEAEQMNTGEKPYTEASVWEIIAFLVLPFILAFLFAIVAFLLFAAVIGTSTMMYY